MTQPETSENGDARPRGEMERLQERLGGKGVPIEPTGEECPHCSGELVKPRSELKQCPRCLFVNNPAYMGNELRDFDLTQRQGRLLLRAAGYDIHGSAGDIENRLRRFCSDNSIERQDLNVLLCDISATGGPSDE